MSDADSIWGGPLNQQERLVVANTRKRHRLTCVVKAYLCYIRGERI